MAGERALPGLGLFGFWTYGSDGWNTLMDTDLRTLSAVVQLAVISRVAALPGAPANGDIYLLTATADVNKIAVRDNGAWVLLVPKEGWQCWVSDTNLLYVYDGAAWAVVNYVAKTGDTMTGALNLNVNANISGLALVSDQFTAFITGTVYHNSNFNSGSGVLGRFARGTLALPLPVADGDRLGYSLFGGYINGAFSNNAGFQANAAVGVTGTQLPTQMSVLTTGDSGGRREVLRLSKEGHLQMDPAGVQTVIDADRIFRLRVYTVATLPAAGTAGRHAAVSDATAPTYRGALVGGGAIVCPVFDNGAAWVSA